MTATLERPGRARRTARPVAPRAMVLRGPGSNCDREAELALDLAGADAERVHVEAVLAGRASLDEVGILVLPGGFAFGDHLGAGTVFAHRLERLGEALERFVASGRPVLGICNGFQVLTRLGLLPGALGPNRSGRFECRWVWLEKPANATTPLLDGIERVAMPVAHGEGRYVAESPEALAALGRDGQIALRYAAAAGEVAYPANPNGSEGNVGAVANPAGNVLGLMPHPERNVLSGLAPQGRDDGAGIAIFRNAVRLAKG